MAGTTAMKAMEMARFGRLHPMGRMADNDEDPYLLKGVKYPGKHGTCARLVEVNQHYFFTKFSQFNCFRNLFVIYYLL